MRFLISALLCVFATTAVAQDYISDAELEKILELSGSTPEVMGMKQLVSCEVYGMAIGGQSDKKSPIQYIATKENLKRLNQQIAELEKTSPNWSWHMRCGKSWQLVSARLTELVGGEKAMAAVEWQEPITQSAVKVQPVRFVIDGKELILKDGRSIVDYHSCRIVELPEYGPILKKGCKTVAQK